MRLVIISDLHCGSRSGLTPPGWQYAKDAETDARRTYGEIQRKVWAWYSRTLRALAPIDTLIVNGDAIEGKGEASGGTELLEVDRHVQCEIAARCIEEAKAKRVFLIRGTPYHTGRDEDFEDHLSQLVDADHVGFHDWIECGGVTFDVKHKTGSSVIPYGRYTAPQRAALWGRLWAERGLQPRAQVTIRSHVHYYGFSGGADGLVMTTPALQLWTKYGSAQCDGTVDLGLVSFDCDKGGYSWLAHLMDLKWAAASPLRG